MKIKGKLTNRTEQTRTLSKTQTECLLIRIISSVLRSASYINFMTYPISYSFIATISYSTTTELALLLTYCLTAIKTMLLIHCYSHCVFFVSVPCFVMQYVMSFLVLLSCLWDKTAECFTLIVFLSSCDC